MTCYFSIVVLTLQDIWDLFNWSDPGRVVAAPIALSPCLLLAAWGKAAKTNHRKAIPGNTFLIFWVTSLQDDLWACTSPVPMVDGNGNCTWEYGMLWVAMGAGKYNFWWGTCKERRLLTLISLCLRPHLQKTTFSLLLTFAIRSPQIPLSCCIPNPVAVSSSGVWGSWFPALAREAALLHTITGPHSLQPRC